MFRQHLTISNTEKAAFRSGEQRHSVKTTECLLTPQKYNYCVYLTKTVCEHVCLAKNSFKSFGRANAPR